MEKEVYMKVLIGENIKRLRKMKGLTQEGLATVFNVSCAAVSKWESGETYPDMSLLFPLAYYFEVSIDELVGYDEEKIKNDIENAINEYWKLYFTDYNKAHELINNAYRSYSNDPEIINLYMLDKAGGNADNNKEVLLNNSDEFMELCNKILNNTCDEKLKLNAWNIKAKVLHAEGKTEEALAIYDNIYPNFYHTSNQKKEQLFAKNTEEFKYYLSLNIYELTDFVLNKKMKEIWYCLDTTIEKKITLSYELNEALNGLRTSYKYNGILLGQYHIVSEIIAYMKKFNVEKESIFEAEKLQNNLVKLCNDLALKDVNVKSYIKKAYLCEQL